ncbi:MAG: hypothetical protein GWN99_00275 [Gemmatimonadetes bacterium]|uniref:Trafficking kinesin-binding protein C-terminal domain-containing protein n=1 Tax=Candidatus Kutchimonas denitrificans TaxID=3056748 RepID=A0AAE4Z5S6_9BACT|nr:hypothetical protein [Gemmatimonadota bacterium]NIR73543.1 hypothetical protein [Candidatus Kutchimonas denitrificans]NIR99502.1 hypothetical protein [Gemmatimonadota bacterium]NIT65122.1 hypothetical protein [Gemmatimonadota bacterium]NIV23655.1 hypothetical protein [Gemmatimonadota bacterium]
MGRGRRRHHDAIVRGNGRRSDRGAPGVPAARELRDAVRRLRNRRRGRHSVRAFDRRFDVRSARTGGVSRARGADRGRLRRQDRGALGRRAGTGSDSVISMRAHHRLRTELIA